MKNIARLNLPKYSQEARNQLIERVLNFIKSQVTALEIIFIGSIITDHFDEVSDIDVVLVFANQEQSEGARHKLYLARGALPINFPVEMICVDRETYERKSQIGGIYFIARHEGFSVNPV